MLNSLCVIMEITTNSFHLSRDEAGFTKKKGDLEGRVVKWKSIKLV